MAKGLTPGQLSKIINDNIGDINKKFRKEVGYIDIVGLILDLIKKGISPVMGVVGRFKQYSKNYVDVIQGKARFIGSKGGGSVRIEPKMLKGEQTSFKVVKKGEDKGKVLPGKAKKATYEKFVKGLGVGKKISPVNLNVSGAMLKTLKYDPKTGELTASHVIDGHNLWDIHNDGTDKIPERRLLPNRNDERFNRRIDQKITEALLKALGLGKGGKSIKKFALIKFNIK